MPKGINIIFVIIIDIVPKDRYVSYIKPVANIRPNKSEVNQLRMTIGGEKLDYPGVTSTVVVLLTTTKIYLNSVISTPDARYLTEDIHNFYYGTPLDHYKYLRVQLSQVPEEIIQQYNPRNLAHDGWVYIEVRKGMAGLKQARKVANNYLTKHLAVYGYTPVPRTPVLWKYHTISTAFKLCIDDFGVKYCS